MPHPAAPQVPKVPGFKGTCIARGDDNYEEHAYQYASTSQAWADMTPALILYPTGDDDVIAAIRYAEAKNVKIAVRTGGHQYCGASSTAGENIQLDLSHTYKEFTPVDREKGTVRTGISLSLQEFNRELTKLDMFVPHGQCSHVHLGGHVQTGGYGQLARSFGLFGDHVLSIEIITADGERKVVKKGDDLFFAVLGGSPGNFGVVTHLKIQAHLDKDHPLSCGMKRVYPYKRERLKRLLDVMVDMANDESFPGDYDYCITMLSASTKLAHFIFPHTTRKEREKEMDKIMRQWYPELFGLDEQLDWPPTILVYAQWANLKGKNQEREVDQAKKWFEKIDYAGGALFFPKIAGGVDYTHPTPMSRLTGKWLFHNVREFDVPFEKRSYLSNSKTLAEDKWSDWVTDRIDRIQRDNNNGCELSVQIQPFGGKNSAFRTNGGDTAYSWRRDSTIGCVLDCFYGPPSLSVDPKETALKWQERNDREGIGLNGKFCKEDRRLLWASFGNRNLDQVWQHYYEDEEKYRRLCAIKQKVDPRGVFTPNAFCVGGTPAQPSPVIPMPVFYHAETAVPLDKRLRAAVARGAALLRGQVRTVDEFLTDRLEDRRAKRELGLAEPKQVTKQSKHILPADANSNNPIGKGQKKQKT